MKVEVDEIILFLKEVLRVVGRLMERYFGVVDKGFCCFIFIVFVIGGFIFIVKDFLMLSVVDF